MQVKWIPRIETGTVLRYPEFGETPICPICTLVKSFNEYYYFKIVSIFKMWSHAHDKDIASNKGHFEVFPKEKGRFFIMPCPTFLIWSCFVPLCHASPDIICTKDKNFEFYNSFPTFWGQKMKFTIHCYYSLSLFTRYCSWHCSLRIFAYLRGVVPYIWS